MAAGLAGSWPRAATAGCAGSHMKGKRSGRAFSRTLRFHDSPVQVRGVNAPCRGWALLTVARGPNQVTAGHSFSSIARPFWMKPLQREFAEPSEIEFAGTEQGKFANLDETVGCGHPEPR